VKRGVIGLILAVVLTVAFLIPFPGMFSPSTLMSMTDPLAGIWGSAYTAKYPSRGKIVMPGLENNVTVIIDGYGVPHIFAKSEIDVAYVLGYLHAHDRLFQMDLQRRLVEGRLSEVLGEAAYQTDVLYRILGLYRGAQKSLELLENISKGEKASHYPQMDVTLIKDDAKKLLDMLDAYSKGVNFAIEEMEKENALPLEFKLLGYKPEPWTPLNILEIGRLISWGLTGTFADLELYLVYQGLVGKYGVENGTKLLLELLPIDRSTDHFIVPENESCIHTVNPADPSKTFSSSTVNVETQGINELLKWVKETSPLLTPIRSMFASNNWVVGGNLTETRKPILCNDPHLQLVVPSVWYEVHYVVKSPDGEFINARGVTFPGIGLIIIGCTQYVGWGFTNVMADQMDFYYYKWNDKGQYLYKGSWKDVKTVNEEILVKANNGYEKRTITLNFTVHGPIIERKGTKFAICWMGEKYGSLESLALLKYVHAKNATEFLKATYYFHTPPQNHAFADIYGNFGWRAVGWYPNRTYPNGTMAIDPSKPLTALTPRLPINGSSENVIEWNVNDWIDANEAPTLWNPKQGYVVTANNRLANKTYPYIYDVAWTFADYYRAYRIDYLIRECIKEKGYVTIEDMKKIQNDVFYVPAAKLVPEIENTLSGVTDEKVQEALNILKEWNYSMLPDLVAPTIFAKWLSIFKNMTLADEFIELNKTVSGFTISKSELEDLVESIPTSILEAYVKLEPNSHWFDNVFTDETENAATIIRESFEKTIELLENEFGEDTSNWKFSKIHKLHAEHPFGSVFSWLNYPEWEAWGWSQCVNNIGASGKSGPSWREILNFKDLNQSLCIIPGGQSGNPFSEHYYDQLRMWLDGEYKQMSFPASPSEVEDVESVLEFMPG